MEEMRVDVSTSSPLTSILDICSSQVCSENISELVNNLCFLIQKGVGKNIFFFFFFVFLILLFKC
jgi:hypothetical protein